jgi:predicted metal-dependent hydrolase
MLAERTPQVGAERPATNRDNGCMTRLDWSTGPLAEGLRCYRAEEFFLAHEHWESMWLEAKEPKKTFLQALIQTTAAFHHLQRGNRKGTASLLRAALRRLAPYGVSFGGVKVGLLREEICACLQALEEDDAPLPLVSPKILLEAIPGEADERGRI